MKNYESPKIEFQDLQLREDVANTCWGGHGKEMSWFYDTEGTGYVSFQIASGECSLAKISNVKFYEKYGADGSDGNHKYTELYNALVKSGGADGNPFKGEGIEFPITPDPTWS